MKTNSKIDVGDIITRKLVEGVPYDFGSGREIVVAVQLIPEGIWIKTQNNEGLFDRKTGHVSLIIEGNYDDPLYAIG